ncbi:MAG: sensor domain-containing diguanylate cyclase [Acidimicrobiales bacterium]|nr:sensor domain-containing diguanylate cyclase [Acidimicrobiales bacterium]MCB9373031.1 sensor domain-containing diguanylate cyclase [Microthrixaceae bacterium]
MTVDEHDADLVPLSDRLAVLLIARLAIAASVIIAVGVVGDVVVDPSGTVELAAVLYAGVTTAVELTRRKLGWRGLLAVSALLVVDGIFLAFVVGQTGGRDSLLTFLIYFHIVAVTLVASYRTGLKVAVWHALLMVGGSSAVVAYYLRGEDPAFDGAAAFRASTLLVLAIGAAAFSSLNERGLNHSRRQIQSLLDLSSDFEREEWPEEICAVLAVHVHRRMRFRRALVVAEEGGRLIGAVADDAACVWFEAPTSAGEAGGVVAECRRTGAPRLVRALDPSADPLVDRLLPFAHNVVAVPMLANGAPVGVLLAEWAGGRWSGLPASTLATLVQSAGHAAMSLRTRLLLGEVDRLARHDGLTGLCNRTEFDGALERELSRAQRTGDPLALVLVDLDHFKAVNDTHGHQTGDEVLRQVGAGLEQLVRREDVAARYGGEEFVVLLPGVDAAGGVAFAERVRSGLREAVDAVALTVSAGVASYPENALDVDALVGRADAALYAAKRGGRDRVVASDVSTRPAVVADAG